MHNCSGVSARGQPLWCGAGVVSTPSREGFSRVTGHETNTQNECAGKGGQIVCAPVERAEEPEGDSALQNGKVYPPKHRGGESALGRD